MPSLGPPSRRKLNVLPAPGLDSDRMSPPSRRASRLLIVRPKPVPPNRRVVESSACVNGWNSLTSARRSCRCRYR